MTLPTHFSEHSPSKERALGSVSVNNSTPISAFPNTTSSKSRTNNMGGTEHNPIDQLPRRTIERILREHPEYTIESTPKAPVKMAAKKQTMTWDPTADQKLLLAVLGHYGEMKLDYDVIAGKMGEHCTPRAVQERIKKLKKQAHAEFDPTSPANSGNIRSSSSKATPTAAKVIRKRTSAAVSNKALQDKVGEPATDDSEPEDVKSEDDSETPRKKRKYFASDACDPPVSQLIGSKVADAAQKHKYKAADAHDLPASELIGSKVANAAQVGFDAV